MISGTVQDLPEHRRAAINACLRQDFFPHIMEDLPPTPDDAVTLSLHMVDEAEVYVLVLGVRYGEIPDGYDKSFTHLELDRALQRGIPVLAMLMDLDRLRELREELRQRQHVSFFDSPEKLRALLIDGLSALESLIHRTDPADLRLLSRDLDGLRPSWILRRSANPGPTMWPSTPT
jgi:hypothetical protein